MTGQASDQHSRVRDQYSPASGAVFYKCVMGDGGTDIHYGIYESESTSMREATKASTLRLLGMVNKILPWERIRRVVDLGSGSGGAAHVLASIYGVHVTCVDICEHHNRWNRRRAAELGLKDRIRTRKCSFEELPASWSARFDVVWSQEAICHAVDKSAVFSQASRVLRAGGVFVFSDIMLAENAPLDEAQAFTDVNAVLKLSTPTGCVQLLRNAGFQDVLYEDWTPFLAENFARMLKQIQMHYLQLTRDGVSAELLDRFSTALAKRLSWPSGSVMRWGAFVGKKQATSLDDESPGNS